MIIGRLYTVTRDVAEDEAHNYLGRAAHVGESFYAFTGITWGAVDWDAGLALCEDPRGPFFEFPRDAVRPPGSGDDAEGPR